MVSPGLARPKQSWVYDFIADPAKIPADSSISADLSAPSTPPTAGELETGRELGALIAKDPVAHIQAIGLSAVQAGLGSAPQVGDGIIRGYLVSVQGAAWPTGRYAPSRQACAKASVSRLSVLTRQLRCADIGA
jgi:hypothetical protein